MSPIVTLLLVTAVAGVGGTGLGGVVSALFRKNSSRVVSLLLSFAGGVMLAVVCFDLIPEALSPEDTTAPGLALLIVIGGLIVGYGVIYLLNVLIDQKTNHEVKHIDEDHPRTADDLDELIHSDHLSVHMEEHSSLFLAGVVIACAIALHNMPEGMIIGASYAAVGGEAFTGSALVLAIVIGFHNIPEGMAVAVPLMSGGIKRGRAMLITALSGFPTVIGSLVGFFLGGMNPVVLSIALSFASGAMLYVVFGELLPEAILMWRSKLPAAATLLGMIVGLVLICV